MAKDKMVQMRKPMIKEFFLPSPLRSIIAEANIAPRTSLMQAYIKVKNASYCPPRAVRITGICIMFP